MPIELIKHKYQKMFKLSSQQLEQEPIDKMYQAMRIEAYIADKQQAETRKAQRGPG